jgi:hypothetical protein
MIGAAEENVSCWVLSDRTGLDHLDVHPLMRSVAEKLGMTLLVSLDDDDHDEEEGRHLALLAHANHFAETGHPPLLIESFSCADPECSSHLGEIRYGLPEMIGRPTPPPHRHADPPPTRRLVPSNPVAQRRSKRKQARQARRRGRAG